MFHAACRLILALVLGSLALPLIAADSIRLQVRDSVDGAPLPVRVELYPAEPETAVTAALLAELAGRAPERSLHLDGRGEWLPLNAPMLARFSAPGHAELITLLEPGSAGWTLWLRPEHGDAREREPVASGQMLLQGVVREPDRLLPVAGALLRLEPLGLETRSDAQGHYRFVFDPDSPALGDTGFLRLQVLAEGWTSQIDAAIPRVSGRVWRHIDLGSAETALHRQQEGRPQQDMDAALRQALQGGSVDDPPHSIRVGFGNAGCTQTCCTGSCTHTCVFDLETYVRRGITYEWIGSWTQQSLRSGTVAYRSYGAWHALNPVAGRPFDLCSSACCQVNGANTTSAGIQAARATAGLLLQRNGAVFRSEYSAENNCLLGSMSCSNADLSCGNGFAGSPAANWPCLDDPVGLNRDCFGHGRGMSQWGTQRWSQAPHARLWPWIVNHYYNASGSGSGLRTATMTRVLAITDVAPEPAKLAPGDSFDIVIEALNRAAESHQAVLIGASIRRASDPFISDPPNDALVELPPGTSLATRRFDLPADITTGSYALWVSLYLDIDGNGSISGNDLVQHLVQIPDALLIAEPEPPPPPPLPDPLFANGFEPVEPAR